MSDIVEVIIKTIDESSGTVNTIDASFAAMSAQLKEMNQSMDVMNRGAGMEGFSGKVKEPVDGITKSFTEMKSAIDLAKQGIAAVQGAYDITLGSVVSYDDSIRSVAAATGMSTEQTSKMIDLTDNFGISTTALTMAQKNLAHEGLALNIDTLKRLGTEYSNLGTQAEKTTFLVNNFGRSGMDFATMFDYGTAAMDKFYNGSADGMVRTKEQVRATMDLTIAQKDLGDAWQGMINKAATPLIPEVTKGVQSATGELDLFQKSMELIFKGDFSGQQKLVNDYWTNREAAINGNVKATDGLADSTKKLYTVAAPTTEQLAAQSQGYAQQMTITMQVAQQTDAFAAAQDNLNQKIGETQAAIQAARAQGYAPWDKHMTELSTQLSQLQGQQNDNAATNAANTKQQVYGDYLKMNSSKELTSTLFAQEQAVGVALGQFTAKEAAIASKVFDLTKQMSDGKITAEAYAKSIAGVNVPGVGEATPQSGQDAAAAWKQAHPDPVANQTASQSTSGAGTPQAMAEQWKQTQATIQTAAKTVMATAQNEFSSYAASVSKQANTAKDSVKSLVDSIAGLGKFGSITITVSGAQPTGGYTPEVP